MSEVGGVSILPPDQRPPEPPEPPPHADLDYRQPPPEPKTGHAPPIASAGGGDGGRPPEPDYPPLPTAEGPGYGGEYSHPPPPPFTPAGFGDSYMGHMLGGGLPPHALREVFSGPGQVTGSSSGAGVLAPAHPDPYPPGSGASRPSGMVFAGDKDHRFEYNHSPLPVEGQPNPSAIHLYNHAMARKDGVPPPPPIPAPGQPWGSPSQVGAPPLPLGFVPHVNSTATIRGRGLPFWKTGNLTWQFVTMDKGAGGLCSEPEASHARPERSGDAHSVCNNLNQCKALYSSPVWNVEYVAEGQWNKPRRSFSCSYHFHIFL